MEYLGANKNYLKENQDCESILVTGGTGLIGTNIKEVLTEIDVNDDPNYQIKNTEKWIFLSSKDGDLRDANVVKEIFQKYHPTIVLHLAAKVGGLYTNMANNLEFFRENIQINDNILQTAFEYKVRKIVSCLSTCIFPDKTSYPIDESMVHNGPPHESNFGYSYAKRMIDVQNRAYNQKLKSLGHDGIFTSIIPCNIFGPWDNFDLKESHVIPGLIHKMYLADKSGESEYTIYGTGSPLRQFIYSRDLAKLVIEVLRKYNDPEPIILSVDEKDEVSIRDVAEMIASNFTSIKNVNTDPSKSDGQFKKTANNGKLRSFLPAFTFTKLDEAIRQTVNWFVSNYEIPDKVRLGKV